MNAIRLAAVSLDAADPAELGAFWRQLLEVDEYFASDDFVALKGAGVLLTVQRVAEHRPPDWPTGPTPKQLHLELAVDDLAAAEQRALELGARRADEQPSPDKWLVLLDPAGHPFCITTLIPET
jgi:Glyoxalase-like domain